MTTSASHMLGGGQFLTHTVDPYDVFVREDLSEEQQLFGRTAAEFMRQEVIPREQQLYAHDWVLTRELLRKAASLDLTRLEIPAAYGGLELDKISAAYVGEQLSVNPSFAGSLGAHTSIGTLPLVFFGTDEQKARYLPKLASAEMIGAYALTEPQAGSDALASKTVARLSPDGRAYILNGQKMWITNGAFADLFTVFAKVDGERFTAFLVERGMGLVSGSDEKKLGLDGSSTTAVMLDNVRVPIENVLGTIGEGHKVAFNVLNVGRVKLGTRNMTGAKRAVDNAVGYARERRQFGRAIAEFGLVRQKIGEMAVRCWVGDAMVYRTLGDVDRALATISPDDRTGVLKTIETFAVECSINKVWTSEALAYAVDEAVQVFGGNGYSREFPVERAYRDARITRIYEGTNEINRLIIPTRLLKSGSGLYTRDRAARALASRLPDHTGPLAHEHSALDEAKRIAAAALAYSADACGDGLKDEQEMLGHIADIVIETYAIDSAIARAEKLAARSRPADADDAAQGLQVDVARLYANDAMDRIALSAKRVAAALGSRGAAVTDLNEAIARCATRPGIDTIAVRRRVADAVIRSGRYDL